MPRPVCWEASGLIRRRLRSPLSLTCNVTIELRDAASGRLLRRMRRHNLVTLVARNAIRDLLNGVSTPATITHFAVGTGATAPAATDAALQTEVFRDMVTKRTPDAGKLSLQYYLPSTAANGYSLTEAGLLTAASGGLLVARVTYQPIAKTASLQVIYNWDLLINAG